MALPRGRAVNLPCEAGLSPAAPAFSLTAACNCSSKASFPLSSSALHFFSAKQSASVPGRAPAFPPCGTPEKIQRSSSEPQPLWALCTPALPPLRSLAPIPQPGSVQPTLLRVTPPLPGTCPCPLRTHAGTGAGMGSGPQYSTLHTGEGRGNEVVAPGLLSLQSLRLMCVLHPQSAEYTWPPFSRFEGQEGWEVVCSVLHSHG